MRISLEWLEGRGPVKRGSKPGEYAVRCPKCADKGKHLGYNTKLGVFHCWRCGFSGRLDGAPSTGAPSPRVVVDKGPPEVAPLSACTPSYRLAGLRYLAGRGFTEEDALLANLGMSTTPGWRFRVMFRTLEGWTGRSVFEGGVRYLTYGGGGDLWVHPLVQEDEVVVVEGPMDALRVRGVALLGTNASALKARRLPFARKYVVALDPDATGRAVEVAHAIRMAKGCKRVELALLKDKDPADGGLVNAERIPVGSRTASLRAQLSLFRRTRG